MSEKEVKCKWSKFGADCHYEKYMKGEPRDVECALCLANGIRKVAKGLLLIISHNGAGRFTEEFVEAFIHFVDFEVELRSMVKEFTPELKEAVEKVQERMGKEGIIPYGLPKDVEKALKRYLKRGDEYVG